MVTGEAEEEEEAAAAILGTTTRRHLIPARTTAASPGAREGPVRSEETTHSRAGGRTSGVPPEEPQPERPRRMVRGGWAGTTTVAGMEQVTAEGTTAAPGAAEEGARRGPAHQGRVAVPARAVPATRVRASARQVVARSLVCFSTCQSSSQLWHRLCGTRHPHDRIRIACCHGLRDTKFPTRDV